MMTRNWMLTTGVAVALFAGATIAEARTVITGARGAMSSTTGGRERGKYKIVKLVRSNGRRSVTVDRVEAEARRLDMSGASASSRPSFHVFLTSSDGSIVADFGAMRVNRHGTAGFQFDSRHTSLPSGVTSVADFSGGTIEIRDSSNAAVLSATIGTF